jgi:hypothetical protein
VHFARQGRGRKFFSLITDEWTDKRNFTIAVQVVDPINFELIALMEVNNDQSGYARLCD